MKNTNNSVSLDSIKELRERTHLGLVDCKQALNDAGGDLDKAMELLYKNNKIKSRNVSAVSALEGAVCSKLFEVGTVNEYGIIFELNCKTDFAANSELFKKLLADVAELIHSNGGFVSLETNPELNKLLDNASLILKERLVVKRVNNIYANSLSPCGDKLGGSILQAYNHIGGKISVLVGVETNADNKNNPLVNSFAENVALQIAAMSPRFVSRNDISLTELGSQTKLFEEQLSEEPKQKPANVWPKIIEGKLNKWCSEVCLLEQESIFEPKMSIQSILDRISKDICAEIRINRFIRYERGEKLGFIKSGE